MRNIRWSMLTVLILIAALMLMGVFGGVRTVSAGAVAYEPTYSGGGSSNPNKDDGGAPYCEGRTLPKEAFLVTMASDSGIYWEPDLRSNIDALKVKKDQTFWTFPALNKNEFVSILIACEIVYVPQGNVVPQ